MQSRTRQRIREGAPDGVRGNRPAVDSVERMLAQAGDAWTFLLLREAFFGVRRFEQFQSSLGAAPNVVSERLKRLVANGLLKRQRYQERPARYEYRLTEKGFDLYPVIVMMMRWGDRWLAGRDGPPLLLTHTSCGVVTEPTVVCSHCRQPITAHDIQWRPGPGARQRRGRAGVPRPAATRRTVTD